MLAVCSLGCDRRQANEPRPRREAGDVTDVVANVGGRPIAAADVAARMADHGIDARTALEELIDEEILLREAHLRGLTLSPDAQRQLERTMVRAMLRDFERELTPDSLPDEEVRADFEVNKDKLQIPERRDSWHILVRGSDEAARARARSILEEVRDARTPRTVYERYAAREPVEGKLEIKAEDLPPISQRAEIEKAYKDALFDAKSEGSINHLVETSYGLHVIVLTEIMPAERTALREVEQDIRDRLSQKKRFEKLVSTVRALEAKGLVAYDDENVRRLLSASSLPKRAE
jgi:hypothetical protein